MDPNDILNFWFGTNPHSLTNQALWFKADSQKLDLIKEKFIETLNRAENNGLSSWCSEARHQLALLIVLGQFTRFIHWGTAQMFSNDKEALRLAKDLLQDTERFNRLTSIEKYFVFIVLLNVEDLEVAKEGLDGVESLQNECLPEQKGNFYS
jgi:uncharacterized protein (DUF924 family)